MQVLRFDQLQPQLLSVQAFADAVERGAEAASALLEKMATFASLGIEEVSSPGLVSPSRPGWDERHHKDREEHGPAQKGGRHGYPVS
jgi:hypothetical protein